SPRMHRETLSAREPSSLRIRSGALLWSCWPWSFLLGLVVRGVIGGLGFVVFSLGRSLGLIGAVGTVGTLGTLGTVSAVSALSTVSTLGALSTVSTLGALGVGHLVGSGRLLLVQQSAEQTGGITGERGQHPGHGIERCPGGAGDLGQQHL